jgi:hypothetical protein
VAVEKPIAWPLDEKRCAKMVYKRPSRSLDTFSIISDCHKPTFSKPTRYLTSDPRPGDIRFRRSRLLFPESLAVSAWKISATDNNASPPNRSISKKFTANATVRT